MITGRLLELHYGIEIDDPDLRAHLELVLADSLGPSDATTLLRLGEVTTGFHLSVNGRTVLERATPTWALSNLFWHLNRLSVQSVAHCVVLHAAAVRWKGRAALVVGASGAGKTTTAIGLAQRGFELISDDIVVVRQDGVVIGSRKPIGLRQDTRKLLLPGSSKVPDPPGPFQSSSSVQTAASILGARYCDGGRCGLIVFPDPSMPADSLDPIPRSEALIRLVGAAFSLGSNGTHGFEQLAGVVEAAEATTWGRGALATLCGNLQRRLVKS